MKYIINYTSHQALLRALRATTGIRLEVAAANLGVSKQFLSQIENEQKTCPMDLFERMLNLYGYEIEIKPIQPDKK